MKRNVSVEIPIRNHHKMNILVAAVLAEHTNLGANSPLTGEVDMVDLAAKQSINLTKRAEAESLHGNAEADMLIAHTAYGNAPGQSIDTPDTVYYLTARVSNRLLFVNKGMEDELSRWGFNVVISNVKGIKTVSVDIPITNTGDMEKLVDSILAEHTLLGAASPLNNQVDMVLLASQLQLSKDKRKSSNYLHGKAEGAMEAADIALGTEEGQSVKTKGTVYYYITCVRDRLLFVHKGEEEQLSAYGFNVVISEGGSGGGVPPVPTPSGVITFDIDETILQDIFPKMAGNASATGVEQLNFDHGDGYETVYTLQNGVLTGFTITFNTAGVYHAEVTEITAGANGKIAVIQFDNCRLSGTLTIPPDVQATNIEVPMNPLLLAVDMQQESYANIASFVVFGCGLLSINEHLIGLDNSGKLNGFANFSGGTNAAPSGLGIAAKNSLIAKGWTVITN